MTGDLFEDAALPPWREALAPGAVVLHGFVGESGPALLAAVNSVVAQVPWRHLTTPGGYRMSVAMSWCGNGWTSRQPRLPLFSAGSRYRQSLAADPGYSDGAGG